MAGVRNLLAFVAVALVAGARAEPLNDLYDICKVVGNMRIYRYHDAESAYKNVWPIVTFLPAPVLLTLLDRPRFISVWDNVIHEAKCTSSPFDDVAVVAKCRPQEFPKLITLTNATREYAKKCLTAEHVEKKIKSNSAGLIRNSLFGDVKGFLDGQFVQDYRADNPSEQAIQLSQQAGAKCCEPDNATAAIVKAVERDLKKQGAKSAKEEFMGKEEKLQGYLRKKLFSPCSSYNSALKGIMSALSQADELIEGGYKQLFASMSQDGQNDGFRYAFCSNLENNQHRSDLVRNVLAALA